jgi:tetratricopeptide (TPR) repeat protein
VDFAVSCSPAAQERFGRAVALLHSFWYDEAEKAFTDVTRLDSSCVMGHWGVAMSNYHPLWAPPSPAEFERGQAAAARAAALPAKTERERDYVAAVTAFYGGPATRDYPARKLAFERAMEQVHLEHPGDREAGIFYALALLGTAPPTDKTYARQKKAAALLNEALPSAPDHPGVAHYLIHSFDYPQLAELALPAARAYSKIATSSPHALHMPSHIFTRLALWDDSIRSNIASAGTALRHVEKTKPGAASFDQLHALDYLEYAYLQQARDGKAKQVLDEMAGVEKLDLENFAAAYALAAVPARYALERRQWKDAAALTVRPAAFPWGKFPYAEALVHFARAVGGARGGELEAARSGLLRLTEIQKGLAAQDAYWAGQVEIQRLAAEAWIASAQGRREEALKLMRAAADLEDSTEKHPVTPGSVLPARELLGDMLLEMGQPAEALAAYESSLLGSPGRFNSLAGAVRAAEAAGEKGKAARHYAALAALCSQSDGSRAELAALRASFKTGS